MKRIVNFLKNKYFLVLVFAGLWITFFDNYNLRAQLKMQKQIEQLERDRDHYSQKIEDLDYQRDRLMNDPSEMERYAREKFFMKKSKEDVFVIPEE